MITAVASITSKNQLTLPVAVASRFNLSAGSKVFIKATDNQIIMEKIPSLRSLHEAFSSLPLAKKYPVAKATKLAQKKEAVRLKYEEQNTDFTDCLNFAKMLEKGVIEVYSFDRDFDKFKPLKRLEP